MRWHGTPQNLDRLKSELRLAGFCLGVIFIAFALLVGFYNVNGGQGNFSGPVKSILFLSLIVLAFGIPITTYIAVRALGLWVWFIIPAERRSHISAGIELILSWSRLIFVPQSRIPAGMSGWRRLAVEAAYPVQALFTLALALGACFGFVWGLLHLADPTIFLLDLGRRHGLFPG